MRTCPSPCPVQRLVRLRGATAAFVLVDWRTSAKGPVPFWHQTCEWSFIAPMSFEGRINMEKRKKKVIKDPRGGLTAAGRKYFAKKEGAHLKPGVKGPADTPEKMRRKGSFLRRHFANLRGPLVDDDGKPTRLALSARAWGEPVPKTLAAARKLAAKGTKLLNRYRQAKAKMGK